MEGRKWLGMALALGLLTQAGCGSWVSLRMPAEYKEKKLTEDPPGYQQDDRSILEGQE